MKESKQMKKNIKNFYKIVVKEHNYIKWRNDLYTEYSDVEVYSNLEIISEYKYYCIQSKSYEVENNMNLFQYFTVLSTIFLSFFTLLMNISMQSFTNSFTTAEKNIELKQKTVDVEKYMSQLLNIGEDTLNNFGNLLLNGIITLIILSCFVWIGQILINFYREKKAFRYHEIVFILEDVMKNRDIKKVET